MAHYVFDKSKIKKLSEKPFLSENEIKDLIESNVELFFGLEYVRSEFQLHGLRVDTLAFDLETKSFVIIEYKQNKNFSVIDQGFAYLALLLNNKADFILEYNERQKNHLKKDQVDWTQSRVIFVSPSFTNYQRQATNFKDLPMELWEIKKYEDGSVSLNELVSFDGAESIKTVSKLGSSLEKVAKEVKKYSVEDHFKSNWPITKEVYQKLRDRILELDSRLYESPQRAYVGFKIDNSVMCGVHIQKSKIILWFGRTQPKDLKDPENKVIYREKSFEYYNQHISDYFLSNIKDVDYAVFLLRQVYERFINLKG